MINMDELIEDKQKSLQQIKGSKVGRRLELWATTMYRYLAGILMIMAGGLGTRLHPLTSNFPKPLIKVAGKPILERILNQAKESGFVNILMSIHFKGELIKDYFGDGKRFGVNIEYIHENKPLGTAGSLG